VTGRMLEEDGRPIRRQVLGDEHVDRALERTTEQTKEFQDVIAFAVFQRVLEEE
jgi:hypothetical protein